MSQTKKKATKRARRSLILTLDDVIAPEYEQVCDPIEHPPKDLYSAFSSGDLHVQEDGRHVVCSGQWAMTRDECQRNLNVNSIMFELEDSEALNSVQSSTDLLRVFPFDSSNYKGSFKIKSSHSNKMETIVDKQIVLKFRENTNGYYNVYGLGVNAYGTFNLVGTMITRDNNNSWFVNLFRTYVQESRDSTNTSQSLRKSSRKVKPPLYQQNCKPEVKLERVMDLCNKILTKLLFQDQLQGSYFAVPVDPIALDIPTYPQIITNPMDLGTIQIKMDSKEITSPHEFHYLVRLVFENAMEFNADTTHAVHQVARSLLVLFNREFRNVERLIQQIGLDYQVNASTSTKHTNEVMKRKRDSDSDNTFDLLNSSMQKFQEEMQQLVRAKSSSAPVSGSELLLMTDAIHQLSLQMSLLQNIINKEQPTSQDKKGYGKKRMSQQNSTTEPIGYPASALTNMDVKENEALTMHEKEALVKEIEELSEENINSVVRIIQHSKPDLADKTDIDIEVDSLSIATQRKMQAFIASVSPDICFFYKMIDSLALTCLPKTKSSRTTSVTSPHDTKTFLAMESNMNQSDSDDSMSNRGYWNVSHSPISTATTRTSSASSSDGDNDGRNATCSSETRKDNIRGCIRKRTFAEISEVTKQIQGDLKAKEAQLLGRYEEMDIDSDFVDF